MNKARLHIACLGGQARGQNLDHQSHCQRHLERSLPCTSEFGPGESSSDRTDFLGLIIEY